MWSVLEHISAASNEMKAVNLFIKCEIMIGGFSLVAFQAITEEQNGRLLIYFTFDQTLHSKIVPNV